MASPRSAQRASTGATVALAALLAVAAFMVVMPLVMAATPPVPLRRRSRPSTSAARR